MTPAYREPDLTYAVEFARRLHDTIRAWYTNADNKAQILLTLNGALLAFFTNALLRRPDDLAAIVRHFGFETFVFLGGALGGTALSIGAAVSCLRSRLDAGDDPANKGPASQLLFFQTIADDRDAFRKHLPLVDQKLELKALAIQIPIISAHVAKKHRWVNIGFVSVGASLGFFILLAASYVGRTS
jgi:hypothetical protein